MGSGPVEGGFEWDAAKDLAKRAKHGVGFVEAPEAFFDPRRLIFADSAHGGSERHYFCLGLVDGRVLTVRFTWRDGRMRLFGAGYWRNGRSMGGTEAD